MTKKQEAEVAAEVERQVSNKVHEASERRLRHELHFLYLKAFTRFIAGEVVHTEDYFDSRRMKAACLGVMDATAFKTCPATATYFELNESSDKRTPIALPVSDDVLWRRVNQ
jgi:hypothetical protein